MKELNDFLLTELSDITETVVNEKNAIHQICLIFTLFDEPIGEVYYNLYTSVVNVDKELLMNATSFFQGMGFLEVQCDCYDDKYLCPIGSMEFSPFFELGAEFRQTNNETYQSVKTEVANFREAILS